MEAVRFAVTFSTIDIESLPEINQPDNTQQSQETDTNVPGGIQTHHLNKRTAADPYFRDAGHWDWQRLNLDMRNLVRTKP
jgi:hypothetical protein